MSQRNSPRPGSSPVRESVTHRHAPNRIFGAGLRTADDCAAALIVFANRSIRADSWQTLVEPGGDLYWLVVTRWTKPSSRDLPRGARLRCPRLPEVRRLQREVRESLRHIVEGTNLWPLINKINRAAEYRYQLDARRPVGEPFRAGPVRADWRISWEPATPTNPRQAALWAVAQTLTVASRIGRCDHCRTFFLARKRHLRRFCSERCSTQFHNERRVASGYFAARRKTRRIGTRPAG